MRNVNLSFFFPLNCIFVFICVHNFIQNTLVVFCFAVSSALCVQVLTQSAAFDAVLCELSPKENCGKCIGKRVRCFRNGVLPIEKKTKDFIGQVVLSLRSLRIVTSFTSVLCAVKEVVFIRDNGLLSKCEFIFYG